MKTELSDIKLANAIYQGHRSATDQQWRKAETYLIKVHDKYGTIDPSIIKNLIR